MSGVAHEIRMADGGAPLPDDLTVHEATKMKGRGSTGFEDVFRTYDVSRGPQEQITVHGAPLVLEGAGGAPWFRMVTDEFTLYTLLGELWKGVGEEGSRMRGVEMLEVGTSWLGVLSSFLEREGTLVA